MNKKTTTKKNTSKTTSKLTVKKTMTVAGIQPLPSGSFRVRKSIGGKVISGVFKKRKEAVAFRKSLTN